LKAGIQIFRYKNMIHSKTGVIDGKWSTIGSLNLDNLSLRYNFEGNLVSTDIAFTKEIEDQFNQDLKECTELIIDVWKKRPWSERFFELLVWPIRKFL
jgi:cardiolipin synthase